MCCKLISPLTQLIDICTNTKTVIITTDFATLTQLINICQKKRVQLQLPQFIFDKIALFIVLF